MTDEAGFLAYLRANPSDAVAWLAFADWLEDHDGLEYERKARYLRVSHELAELGDGHPARDDLVLDLRDVAMALPANWVRSLARVPIENCAEWRFECPKRWDELETTPSPNVRRCGACRQTVYYCQTSAELREHAGTHGHCVAVDLRVLRRTGDLDRIPDDIEHTLVGLLTFPDEWEPEPPPKRPWWRFW
jgi:uncharacterized protein (TIGR02996 family)